MLRDASRGVSVRSPSRPKLPPDFKSGRAGQHQVEPGGFRNCQAFSAVVGHSDRAFFRQFRRNKSVVRDDQDSHSWTIVRREVENFV